MDCLSACAGWIWRSAGAGRGAKADGPARASNPRASPESKHWSTLRAGVTSMANTKSLLNEVREKQCTKLYEDDWTVVAAGRTTDDARASGQDRWSAVRRGVNAKIATDSLLSEMRAQQTEGFFEGDWTALLAANPQESPSRTPAQGHWDTVRSSVKAKAATDALLDDIRAQQTEELFEQDWTAPSRGPPPAATGGHGAVRDESAAAAGGASQESTHWSALRAGVASMANTRALLDEVREKQCAKLYEDDWTAAAAERAAVDAQGSAQDRHRPAAGRGARPADRGDV